MSYNKTNWQTGDTITADKLNNIESGVEAADKQLFVVRFYQDEQGLHCDKMCSEILAAIDNNQLVIGEYSRLGTSSYYMSTFDGSYVKFGFFYFEKVGDGQTDYYEMGCREVTLNNQEVVTVESHVFDLTTLLDD